MIYFFGLQPAGLFIFPLLKNEANKLDLFKALYKSMHPHPKKQVGPAAEITYKPSNDKIKHIFFIKAYHI